jgi:DNA-binding LytR/AlgR family response regulator
MFDALFLFGLTFLLWKVAKYGNFKTLTIRQRFVNYFALGFLLVAIWQGLSFLTLYLIMGESQMESIISASYTKVLLASLVYVIVVLYLNTQTDSNQTIEPINEETDEITPPETSESAAETEELEKLERIVVRTGQKIDMITIPEVVYFQAEGDYVRIFTDSGKFLKEDTIKFYQARLSETEFVRVHRSYLVNVSKILRIELYEKQTQMLSLSNGDKLKISASGYKRLREVLGL